MGTRIWRVVATCALLFAMLGALAPTGSAIAQETGTPVAEPSPTETATEVPVDPTEIATETATSEPTEPTTETPVEPTETVTAEASETASATASATPEDEESSFSIASVSANDPVVSPSTSVGNGATFTVSVTLSMGESDVDASVELLTTHPFSLASAKPAISSTNPSNCDAATDYFGAVNRAGSCTFTWTFTVASDMAPGQYNITFRYLLWNAGEIDFTRYDRVVSMNVPPAIVVIDPTVSPSMTLVPGQTFSITTGVTLNALAQTPLGVAVTVPPAGITLQAGSPTSQASDGASCQVVGQIGAMANQIGTCRFTWTYRVNDGAAAGSYSFQFTYGANGFNATRDISVRVTVPPVFTTPAVVGDHNR